MRLIQNDLNLKIWLVNPVSFIEKLVPKPFREFLPYVSISGLKVVHKEEVLKIALNAAKNYFSEPSEKDLKKVQNTFNENPFLKKHFELSLENKESEDSFNIQELPNADQKKIGEILLTLYFFMIFNPEVPTSLDLRLKHFSWDKKNKILKMSFPKLSFQQTKSFSHGIQNMYEGFFQDDSKKTKEGLKLFAYGSKGDSAYFDRMEKLLKKHFGDARSQSVSFTIQQFKETFHLVFEEAIQSQARFHPELTFIGTTLVGLYLSLEKTNLKFNVVQCFEEARKK